MLADTQRTVYPKEVTRQLHVMAQDRESSPVIDRRSDHCVVPERKKYVILVANFLSHNITKYISKINQHLTK